MHHRGLCFSRTQYPGWPLADFASNMITEPKVSPATFCRVFPFHLMFDRELIIIQAGRTVSRLLPRVTKPGCKITDVLDTVRIVFRSLEPFQFRILSQRVTVQSRCTRIAMSEHNHGI